MYDLIIIGAGPAGLTAGIYAARANLKTLILEKETIGGQISSSPKVENYPGFTSISGAELSDNLFNQATSLGVSFELEEVVSIKDGKTKIVKTDFHTYETKAIIIATGAKYRLLGIANEKPLLGKGIHFCATCDGPFYKEREVAVIGGANTAVTNAIYLSNICKKVYLIYRKDHLNCEESLMDDLKECQNIEVIYNANVIKIMGEDELQRIVIDENGKERELTIDGMFLSIGMTAQTDVGEELNRNNQKYIIADNCDTDFKGIFVAGDCRDKEIRQLTTATSDGTIAATHAIKYIKTLSKTNL